MTVAVHTTKPYGQYLSSWYQEEVIREGARFFVDTVQLVKKPSDSEPRELERRRDPTPQASLDEAIKIAEQHRRDFIQTAAEEAIGAALDMAEEDWRYHSQTYNGPFYGPFEDDEVQVETRQASTPGTVCNTRIEYLYRDQDNLKQYETIVVAGELSEREQQELRDTLSSDCFIPEQVGMRALQTELAEFGSGKDNPWHEINEISVTDEPITFPGTAQELLAKFKAADWDPSVCLYDSVVGVAP